MQNLFNGIYKGKKVLVTGNTGFKGSWLCFWLSKLGAEVLGYSLSVPTDPSHFDVLCLNVETVIADIRNRENLYSTFEMFKPEIVFHLAAQPLVRDSYLNPVETFETNIIGTVNVFEACKRVESVKAIVNVTSDKCYENVERQEGYRENEPMGGYDPYSCSKGCAELLTSSYRKSFFNLDDYGIKHSILLASCRAGNVIGGGDWAKDRLIPDAVRSASKKAKVEIRSPKAIRPWQHVLEPLSAYLMVGQKLLEGDKRVADAWNFGPSELEALTVSDVLDKSKKIWSDIDYFVGDKADLHEAHLLKLNCEKANEKLKWFGVWDIEQTFTRTINWYKNYYQNDIVSTQDDLDRYVEDAKKKKIEWSNE